MSRRMEYLLVFGFLFALMIVASCSSEDSATAENTAAATVTTTTVATATAATSTTEAATPPDQAAIEQLISDYMTAVGLMDETFNRDDFLALVEDSFRVTEHRYYAFGAELRHTGEHVVPAEEAYTGSAWQLEYVSEPVIAGTGPWVVSVVENYTRDPDYYEGTATYVVVEDDGALKVADKYWIGHYATTMLSDATTTTKADAVEPVVLRLTFDGASCTYEGPTELAPGPVELIFHNESEGAAATNMVSIDEGYTIQDVIDDLGPEPSTGHHPPWTRELGTWRSTASGESHNWEGNLEAGSYAAVCARISPLGVWFGFGLTVEE